MLIPFSKSASRKRLKTSYDRYQLNPGETESVAVCRQLLRLGRLDEAFRWARRAKSHFPGSRKVEKVWVQTRRLKTEHALDQARSRARHNPSATSLVRYAELLRIAGRWRQALRVATKAHKKHPGDWEVQLALGRIWFQRFGKKRDDAFGWRAVEHLEAALTGNPGDYASLLLLAMTLVRLASWEDAANVIGELLRIAPGDAKATSLQAHVRSHLGEDVEADASRSALAEAPGEPQHSATGLESVMSIPGAVGAFEFDESGEVVDTIVDENDQFDLSVPVEVVESMASAIRRDVQRLGLGDIRACTLRGEGWNMGYMPDGSGTVMVFCEGEVSEEQIAVDMEAVLGATEAPA